ncbi:putative disease resistance protein RGA1 [Triticum dicoccoides]|uniref:putative disease resistance protein RGA1 n=1 Tax=Triticum dicoccoides TaxID=85692 RepID=UPI00188F26D9|nr:putative disease resistance protein RGA1 [Triticum dicoccoides]XP_037487491.1 putative disease resistance protein RGA1 [Triticum dicoccoides]
MTGVLNALASYVTKMLADMAREEVAMLIGVSSAIDDLTIKLGDLQNFLADADRRNITDESVRGWVEQLKHAMYHATDIIDLCQLKAMEQGPSKDMGCLNPMFLCIQNPLHVHDIGSRIKALNKKLDNICKRGRSFNFIKLEVYQDQKTNRSHGIDRKTNPLLERSGVVGEKIEDDTRSLVQLLTKEVIDTSDSIMVFAIVGVGGIGKTTLSKKIFNDEAIQGKFTKKIWLSITQEFSEVDLLRTAITTAEGNLPGPGGGSQDKTLLVPALASAIKDKKLFLVLDDMWGTYEWTNLLKAPISHSAPGSRVLVTTRHETVARGMKAVNPYHRINKLGPKDGWSLLTKQVLMTEKSEPAVDMLKDIGLQIVEKCDGLPLAIKVMGGLLCQKEKTRHDWEKVLNDAVWSIHQMPEELNHAIYLSYEDLSPCLKQCFLHFSLKPKKMILDDTQFVDMWIGEGFVNGDLDRLEEIGTEYHKELRLRNLIESDTSYASQYVCKMHDVIRSFAQFMTRNEALVAHNGETVNSKLHLQRFLRLSIETNGLESDEFEWRSLQEQISLRSLMLIGNFKVQSGDSLVTFPSLRTLHVESAEFATMVESLYHLKHLRYLSMDRCADIDCLPENIHKMKFLQHISLEGCENLVKLPDSIVKLTELRYLQLEGTGIYSIPRGFHALTNLRTLSGFRVHMDGDWCSLEELGPLSQLRGIGLVGLGNVSDASFVTKVRLDQKVHLSRMRLLSSIACKKNQGVIEEVFNELSPPPCIEIISVEGYIGRHLPRWMMSTATMPLNSLRTLVMEDLACCIQLPDGLCQLPLLDYLQVNRAPAIKCIGPEFVGPQSHRCYPSSHMVTAFPRLREMDLLEFVELEEWEWEEEVQAMPVLDALTFTRCNLKCIPPGLASHAKALKKLTLWSMWRLHSLENFASVVELDLYDLPKLISISNFPELQKLEIKSCPELTSLEEMSALRRLVLTVPGYGERFRLSPSKMGLPLYIQTVNPSHLLVDCGLEILGFMAAGKSGSEWDKFSHIQHVEAYADSDCWDDKKWHVLYTREPFSIETNVQPAFPRLLRGAKTVRG